MLRHCKPKRVKTQEVVFWSNSLHSDTAGRSVYWYRNQWTYRLIPRTLVPSQKPRNAPGSSFGDVIHSTQKHREIASTMDRLLSIIESGRAGNNSKFSGALINCCFVLPRVTAPEIRWKCRTPRILLRGIQNIKHRAVIHLLTHLRLK